LGAQIRHWAAHCIAASLRQNGPVDETDGWRRHLPLPLRVRGFALFALANVSSNFAMNMAQLAIGYQVYVIHRSQLDLGLVPLAAFIPLPLVALPAGQLADRFPRRKIFVVSNLLDALVMVGLVAVSLSGAHQLWPFLALAAATGVATVVGAPAARAMSPMLVPEDLVASAMALRSTTFQFAVVTGPAVGGVLLALDSSGVAVYSIATALCVAAAFAAARIREPVAAVATTPLRGWASLVEGLRFVRRTEVLLGAIALDLFAVLFAGAVALLPVFALDILHVGRIGLGVMRAAPAVGAVTAGVWLARHPLQRREGRTLLIAVAGFGLSMVVFGLSHSFALSLLALALSGFTDMFSMSVRGTTVAMATPDELRGRVNAVEMVFISGSNELGGFESGAAAALIGTVPAVVIGGGLTVGLALVWKRVFPALARIDGLASLRPARLR
jgi:MFS family permease